MEFSQDSITLTVSYLQTIQAISVRLHGRENRSKANAKLYKNISLCAIGLEKRISVLEKRVFAEPTDTELQEQIRNLPSKLRGSRELLTRSPSRKEIVAVLNCLLDAEKALNSPPKEAQDLSIQLQQYRKQAHAVPSIPGYDESTFSAKVRGEGLYKVFDPHVKSNVNVNIIFVHSLNGDAYTTWRGQTSIFWPRDFLGPDLESAKIWTYSYRSNIDMKSIEQKPFEDLLEKLADKLLEAVNREIQDPVVWVAHSLGGLLVKSAMIQSKYRAGVLRTNILEQTRGVLFLGTPHSGSTLVTRSAVFTRILTTTSDPKQPTAAGPLAGETSLTSTVTLTTRRFAIALDQARIPIVSFYETMPMLTESGPFKIVEEITNLSHPRESVESLEGNHVTMCKFECAEEKGYQKVLTCILDMKDQKFVPKRTRFFDNKIVPRTPSKGSSATDALSTDIGMIYTRLRKKLDVPLARWKSAKTHDHRDGMWIKDSSTFKNWMEGPLNGVLLVYGPVGCGKTVIAESIMEHLRDTFTTDSTPGIPCHLHLFFRSDQRSQQDPVTVLESLVAQMLDQNKLLVRHLPHQWQVTDIEARAALEGTLRVLLDDTSWSGVYLVVDALDECYDDLAPSAKDIFALLLEARKDTKTVFTTSAEAMLVAVMPVHGHSEGSAQGPSYGNTYLTFLIEQYLMQRQPKRIPLELRKDNQWIDAVSKHIEERLITDIEDVNGEFHGDLKDALLRLPQISFSVADLAIQRVKEAQLSSKGKPKPPDWFKSELAGLSESASMYDCLLSLAQTQPKYTILTLSILACACEPLRIDQLAMVIIYDEDMEPQIPEQDDWNAALKLSESLKPLTPTLLIFDDEGVHLSNDALRRIIRQQMNREDISGSPLSRQFERYEKMQERMAQSCLRILLHETKVNNSTQEAHYFPLRAYADRNWRSHLRESNLEGEALNGLVFKVIEMQQRADNRARPAYKNTSARLLHFLATENLSTLLNSMYSGSEVVIDLPSPSDFNSMLDDSIASCTTETLRSLQSVRLKNQEGEEVVKIRQRLDIAVAIKFGHQEKLLDKLRATAAEVREKSLRFAIRTQSAASFDIILTSMESSLIPSGTSALFEAVKKGNRQLVTRLLSKSKRLVDVSLNECLIEATWPHKYDICEDLMKHGADQNSKTSDLSTPLHLASNRGHSKLVALMLRWNALPNAKDNKERTPLHRAAQWGHDNVVRLLLAGSASVVEKDMMDRTAFFIACARGWRLTAEILWQAGSQLVQRDSRGQTPLHAAAKMGHQSVVQMLLLAGIDPNHKDDQGITPLHEAARSGWVTIVTLLLESGASIDARDKAGFTCLHHACASKNAPEVTVQYLLERGADATACTERCEELSKIKPSDTNLESSPPTSSILSPSLPPPTNDGKRTPLLIAAENSTVRVLKIFFNHNKAFFDHKSEQGRAVRDYVFDLEKSMSKVNQDEKRQFLDHRFPVLVSSRQHNRHRSTGIQFPQKPAIEGIPSNETRFQQSQAFDRGRWLRL